AANRARAEPERLVLEPEPSFVLYTHSLEAGSSGSLATDQNTSAENSSGMQISITEPVSKRPRSLILWFDDCTYVYTRLPCPSDESNSTSSHDAQRILQSSCSSSSRRSTRAYNRVSLKAKNERLFASKVAFFGGNRILHIRASTIYIDALAGWLGCTVYRTSCGWQHSQRRKTCSQYAWKALKGLETRGSASKFSSCLKRRRRRRYLCTSPVKVVKKMSQPMYTHRAVRARVSICLEEETRIDNGNVSVYTRNCAAPPPDGARETSYSMLSNMLNCEYKSAKNISRETNIRDRRQFRSNIINGYIDRYIADSCHMMRIDQDADLFSVTFLSFSMPPVRRKKKKRKEENVLDQEVPRQPSSDQTLVVSEESQRKSEEECDALKCMSVWCSQEAPRRAMVRPNLYEEVLGRAAGLRLLTVNLVEEIPEFALLSHVAWKLPVKLPRKNSRKLPESWILATMKHPLRIINQIFVIKIQVFEIERRTDSHAIGVAVAIAAAATVAATVAPREINDRLNVQTFITRVYLYNTPAATPRVYLSHDDADDELDDEFYNENLLVLLAPISSFRSSATAATPCYTPPAAHTSSSSSSSSSSSNNSRKSSALISIYVHFSWISEQEGERKGANFQRVVIRNEDGTKKNRRHQKRVEGEKSRIREESQIDRRHAARELVYLPKTNGQKEKEKHIALGLRIYNYVFLPQVGISFGPIKYISQGERQSSAGDI
ncbi:unnamed protein product, partial [Trichogramma brassicae]